MDLKEKFDVVFNSGLSFNIQNAVKRIDGEWYMKIIWEHIQLPLKQVLNTSIWEGFDTIEECVDDILEYLKLQLGNKQE